ncbi:MULTISPECIES: sulfotransferase [unclassified Microbulbifer]|uniref:tetratricopeptide repeat-containing sulfotransferase family protein n=1 Tax=unclassified Microbulbifer TaxID=2619833 RepID=UPI0027E49B92|nr:MULTISPECIES: sulfotransferase [unclassified Microbulbifer]
MQSEQPESVLSSIQQKIQAGQFDSALADLSQYLAQHPDETEALYMSAVCHRYQGSFEAASACLARVKALAPDHGRAHQEEGHLYRRMGALDEALAAYSRACQINPVLEASWRAQWEILQQQGREAEAIPIRAQLERLRKLPKVLVAVTDLIAQGKLQKAEKLCRQFLEKVPHHIEAMRLLADIGLRLGVLEDAEFLLESAVQFSPDNVQVRMDYIQALRKRQKFQKALNEAKHLLDQAPDNVQFKSLFAIESLQVGDYETALRVFDEVLDRVPGDANTLTSKGHALKTCGRFDEAVGCYKAALANRPHHGEAYFSLANLKVYTFSDREVEQMLQLEQKANLTHMQRVYLCFALGKAYEDRREYALAFEHYTRGNQLKKAQSRYRAEQLSEDMQAQHRVCTRALFESRASTGHPAPDPIFIVGLPRAGSTLLEQILSSHSQVDGTLELPNILSLSQRLRRLSREGQEPGYPEILQHLSDAELAQLGEEYLHDTRIHRRGAPFFIDKMPNNFRHIGLIKLILPNAKIIDARRHPMACCFSGYKQLFAEGQEFSYDLRDLGQYYRDYVELMDHWDAVLPGFVLRVQHEDVVADLETQVRRMLEFCQLPFEQACLEFHKTERNVRTPSSEQVRQPIYRSAVEQWRHFEPWLSPLKETLGASVLARYRMLQS